jgi:hypothetical protein
MKHGAVVRQGQWTVGDNNVDVVWEKSGAAETWLRPVSLVGQSVVTEGRGYTAKRISHPREHGALQG